MASFKNWVVIVVHKDLKEFLIYIGQNIMWKEVHFEVVYKITYYFENSSHTLVDIPLEKSLSKILAIRSLQ